MRITHVHQQIGFCDSHWNMEYDSVSTQRLYRNPSKTPLKEPVLNPFVKECLEIPLTGALDTVDDINPALP